MHQTGSPDVLLAAIRGAGNEVTQGWMRLISGEAAPWMDALQRNQPLHAAYLEKQTRLWRSMLAGRPASVVDGPADRRFAAREWRENSYYDYLRQSYLLASRFVEDLVEASELQPDAKERVRFAARQWLDALCPANFAGTNPEAMRRALESRGESLTRGLANLLTDAHKGRISQTDESAFEVGRNLGLTPGSVVFENELIQLLQYKATTAEVAKRPLVMVPPCINKFYILDLQPENSFVAHAVANGHTVFMISWRNVGPELGHLTWDDYLEKGLFTAFGVAKEICGSQELNALGFCVGGTLLGAALAVMAAKGDASVKSVTFLATMLDFGEPGQIGLFVDEASVGAREAAIGRGGILPGGELAFVFSSLRANDLVWNYVVSNYLLGSQPPAFDLLYWNSDGTNLPGPMYCYYLRNTYLENRLREPGALLNCGVPVDLGRIDLPTYIVATREDHIVPWRSAYRTLNLVKGEKTFVLGASGHIAGIVNPLSKNRRSHWLGSPYPHDPDEWLSKAKEVPGSWWGRWAEWLAQHRGGTRKAPKVLGTKNHRPLEPAPGRYVKERLH
ncbi:MAG TPA: class I poly(R)-hydroxyalkanoic acid synthase [Burkholderiales bacterium]|nr:class I poly(R)-hydroxyalkanoic acid synthase [Burkholderiales bacterium]